MNFCLRGAKTHVFNQNLPTPVLSVSGARVRISPSQPHSIKLGTPDFLCGCCVDFFQRCYFTTVCVTCQYIFSKICIFCISKIKPIFSRAKISFSVCPFHKKENFILSAKISTCKRNIYSVQIISCVWRLSWSFFHS